MGIAIDDEHGGAGMDNLAYAIAVEEMARGCGSAGVILSAHHSLYCAPVEKWATPEQKVSNGMEWNGMECREVGDARAEGQQWHGT